MLKLSHAFGEGTMIDACGVARSGEAFGNYVVPAEKVCSERTLQFRRSTVH